MKRTVFYSQIGPVIGLLLIVTFGFVGFQLFADGFSFTGLLFFLIPILFVVYVVRSIKYIIYDGVLTVTDGFLINEKIPIKEIRKIRKSNSVLASPAASLDRLEISYSNSNLILISPKKRKDFINQLLSINPTIRIGDGIL